MIIIISLEKRKTNLVNDMKKWTKLISRSSCKNKAKYLPKLVKFKIRIWHPLSRASLLRNLKLIAKNIYLIYWLGITVWEKLWMHKEGLLVGDSGEGNRESGHEWWVTIDSGGESGLQTMGDRLQETVLCPWQNT